MSPYASLMAFNRSLSPMTFAGMFLDAIKLYQADAENYLNKELMVLEHFKYPAIFIRKTEKAYITVLNDYLLDLLENSKPVAYEALKSNIRRRSGATAVRAGSGRPRRCS